VDISVKKEVLPCLKFVWQENIAQSQKAIYAVSVLKVHFHSKEEQKTTQIAKAAHLAEFAK